MTLNDPDRKAERPDESRLLALWTRLRTPAPGVRRRPRTIGLTLVLALIVAAGLTASFGPHPTAVDNGLPGVPVPASQVEAISQAALSCPALTGPRLAAQIMAASGFNVNASTAEGGLGVAGLTDEQWQRWVPWPDAPRMDPTANITALAHVMCDLVGQLRLGGMNGELWPAALAANRAGLDAVRQARAIPPAVTGYVETVSRYAVWYAGQPEFRVGVSASPPPQAASVAAEARPVPEEYVGAVVAAGRACPTMSGPRVAAQLMAASAFNPNLLGSNGGQGIAQFLPAVWDKYGTVGQSPWDPMAAIPTLGRTMCALAGELGGLGTDPYPMALAAFQWGASAVQQAGGMPDAPSVREYAARVLTYVDYYAKDGRLGGTAAGSGSSAPPTGTGPATTTPPSVLAGGAPPTANTTTAKPANPGATKPAATTAAAPTGYMIVGYGGKCVTVPGGKAVDGTQLQMRDCTGGAGQRWAAGADGSLRTLGMCMDLAMASSDNGTKVQLARCNGGWAQRFWVNDAHDLVNSDIGKCVDVQDWSTANGALLQLWDCGGTDNQKFSKQS